MLKFKLCCITLPCKDRGYEEQVERLCKGGADAVRFSAPDLSARAQVEMGRKLKALCRRNKALLLVDGRPDIALAVAADGLHLNPEDIPVEWARQVLGPRILIGASATSLGQALEAAESGVNYISVGPLFTVQEGGAETNVDIIRLVKKRVKAPVLAEGNLTKENVAEAVKTGAEGIMESGIAGVEAVETMVQELKERILQVEAEQENLIKE